VVKNLNCGIPHVEVRAAEFLAVWSQRSLHDTDVEERLAALEQLALQRGRKGA
jgi:hypothetical protein